eukprot:TRINITY_DN454_c0_g1_i2.p3 TRINITY_DN454_c0_g1~~TRINITY_DN454_c0_g1_i2.p3  ORF type:complete len:192 (-),score=43.29 TRINITY_DN454_c0_g1_i2:820-1395(-)
MDCLCEKSARLSRSCLIVFVLFAPPGCFKLMKKSRVTSKMNLFNIYHVILCVTKQNSAALPFPHSVKTEEFLNQNNNNKSFQSVCHAPRLVVVKEMQAELSAAEKEKLTAFFNTLDTNKNGLLSASELAVVGSKMNVQGVDKAKCQAFIDSCNNTKGESFDLAKFFFCAANFKSGNVKTPLAEEVRKHMGW